MCDFHFSTSYCRWKICLIMSLLCLGVHRVWKAAAFWELCHQAPVSEGENEVLFSIIQSSKGIQTLEAEIKLLGCRIYTIWSPLLFFFLELEWPHIFIKPPCTRFMTNFSLFNKSSNMLRGVASSIPPTFLSCLCMLLLTIKWYPALGRTTAGQTQLYSHDQIHQSSWEPKADDEYVKRQQPQHPIRSLPRL